jgi:uncharacterized phosphosugar-binding protein
MNTIDFHTIFQGVVTLYLVIPGSFILTVLLIKKPLTHIIEHIKNAYEMKEEYKLLLQISKETLHPGEVFIVIDSYGNMPVCITLNDYYRTTPKKNLFIISDASNLYCNTTYQVNDVTGQIESITLPIYSE